MVFHVLAAKPSCDNHACAFCATGSVTAANCKELAAQPDVDGFLVGGASLKVMGKKSRMTVDVPVCPFIFVTQRKNKMTYVSNLTVSLPYLCLQPEFIDIINAAAV